MIDDQEIDNIITRLIKREGGFVDHPNDAGGPTKFGLTMAALTEAYARPASPDDVRALQYDDAQDIYRAYWFMHPQLNLHELSSDAIAEMIFDTAVLFGRGRAAQWTQWTVGVEMDGFIGPVTRAALDKFYLTQFVDAMAGKRFGYHADRVWQNPDQKVFWDGWINRLVDVRHNAIWGESPRDIKEVER